MRTARNNDCIGYFMPITNTGIDVAIAIMLAYLAYPEEQRVSTMGATVLAAADGVFVGSAIAYVAFMVMMAMFTRDMLVYFTLSIAKNEIHYNNLMAKARDCTDNNRLLRDAVRIKFASFLMLMPVFLLALWGTNLCVRIVSYVAILLLSLI